MRAVQRYDVNVVGLTLSKNQQAHVQRLFDASSSPRTQRVLLNGWEQFDEPVDRIVSIGAFEHFGANRYDDFFTFAHDRLPPDGVMLLHTILAVGTDAVRERGLPITMTLLRFIKFILTEIFPGGQLPGIDGVTAHAAKAGFAVTHVQSLQPHYARTLDLWAAALRERHDDAVAIASEQVYQRYMKYLTGCAELFRDGYTDVCQFTLHKR
jgi:cyclopropane-fatty-acyl-phospholipid synthase